MNFSMEWDKRYRENAHMSIWPWSDLVSLVYRFARPDSPDFRVLELGCGAGANIPLFQSFGIQYFAIEGSESIVANLKTRFPEFRENIVAGDFTAAIPFSGQFDLIVDRASLTHNSTQAIRYCLDQLYAKLKPGGKFIGVDWFSTEHSDYTRGKPDADPFTRTGYSEGSFAEVGRVHFSDAPHLEDLFKKFEILSLEHTLSRSVFPDNGRVIAGWNIAARKP